MGYRAAVVGVGPGRDVDISGRSHSFGYKHADAYHQRDDCELVAGVDLVGEYAEAFADEYGLPPEAAYEDHEAMLGAVEPDIVSVCTPIPAHEPVVVDCAEAGVAAVHCEKPMAKTWAEARGMAHVCDRAGTQLTFGHQRRFAPPFRKAKELLDAGRIGDLERIEISWGNFFDNGTHVVDLAGMFVDDVPAKWVLGQVDYSREHVRYGVPTADHAFVTWRYESGVQGVLATGDGVSLTDGEYDFYDCWHRLVGSEGTIEIGRRNGPPLRIRRDGDGWEPIDVEAEFSGSVATGVDSAVEALETEATSPLRAANALNTTEILFAGHESSRRRGRVGLPLSGVYDHPLASLVDAGEVEPTVEDDRPPHPADEREE